MPNATLQQRIKTVPGAMGAYRGWLALRHTIQGLLFRAAGDTHYGHTTYNTTLGKALEGKKSRTDISDHLGTLFFFATGGEPKLVVELGTRGGESTHALLAASSLTGAPVLSVDIADCGHIKVPHPEHWNFVQADDIEFANSGFVPWCHARGLAPKIDVLFIDTSHEYEHTRREIEVWPQYLAEHGLMIFHDTNMGRGVYARNDGSLGFGWGNQRGVMRAVEEFMGRDYDGNLFFSDASEAFSVLHFPHCSGLTVFRKRGAVPPKIV